MAITNRSPKKREEAARRHRKANQNPVDPNQLDLDLRSPPAPQRRATPDDLDDLCAAVDAL